MKKRFSVLALALVMVLSVAAGAVGGMVISVDPINIQVNGQTFQPKDVNGKDVPVFAYNGTTYAPLRALAEAYGLTVGYDAAANMATVTDPSKAPATPATPAEPAKPATPAAPSGTPVGAGTYTFKPSDVNLGADAKTDKAVIPAGTTFANGALTVVVNDEKGKVVQRWQESKGGVYAIEVDKDQGSALEFTVSGSAEVTLQAASTGGSNTSMVGIVNIADGSLVKSADGKDTVTGTAATPLKYSVGAGTYQIVSPVTEDENMNRGFRVMGVEIVVK